MLIPYTMGADYHYITETSNVTKVRAFFIGVLVIIIVVGAGIAFTQTIERGLSRVPGVVSLGNIIVEEIAELTPTGLFYTGFFGGLFFIPIAQEIFYYYGLLQGNPIFLSLLTVNAGYFLAQGVNYFAGLRLNRVFMHIVSKRRLYSIRRTINTNGGTGVFWFNVLPLPAPLLTFALGIAKYNPYRTFFYTIVGTFIKYVVIVLFFVLVN